MTQLQRILPARRYVLVLVLVLIGIVTSANAEIKTITSLPYTVTTSDNYDTLVIAGTKLTSSSRAISFADDVHDVYLDLGQDTLVWNTGGGEGVWGIEIFRSNIYNITIDGGYILHAPPASALDINYYLRARVIGLGGQIHDITIKNCYLDVYGRNSQIIYGGNGCYNVEIYNCTFKDGMTAFTQRDIWIDNAMLALGNNNSTSAPGFEYHFKIHACSTVNAHWVNLYLQGEAMVAEVYDNFFISDARNDLPNSGIIYGTAAQCYAVSIRGRNIGSRVKCYNNTIRSGNNYAGGRGIFISGIDGISLHPDSSIYIYNNDIYVHQGNDEEETTLNGILVREGWKNVYIRENRIVCIGDTDPSTSAIDHGPISGLRLTGPGDGLKIVGNTVQTYFVDDFVPDYDVSGTFAAAIVFDEFDMNLPNVSIDSNYFESNSLIIRWGFFNGHGGNVTMRDNTYSFYNGQGEYVFYLGYGAGGSHHAYNNRIINGEFINNANSTNIYMADFESDSLSIGLAKTVEVQVTDSQNSPRGGVEVSYINAYGNTVAQGTTNANGTFSSDVTYWWESNDTFSEGDSIGFNNFSIITRDGDNVIVTDQYISENLATPLQIVDPNADYTPPAPVTDLSVTGIDILGRFIINWTSTGDDSTSGQLDRYELWVSDFYFGANNYQTGILAAVLNNPKPAGEIETVAIGGLDTTTSYFFAVVGYDDAANTSVISNIALYAYCPDGCTGERGNIDNDDLDVVDITDLLYMVEYMIASGAPPICPVEADVDRDNDISISDLLYLVDYMFDQGPPPLSC